MKNPHPIQFGKKSPEVRIRTYRKQIADRIRNHFTIISGGYSLASVMDKLNMFTMYDLIRTVEQGAATPYQIAQDIYSRAKEKSLL